MEFYNITIGKYDDFVAVKLGHERVFNSQEIATMFNEAVRELNRRIDESDRGSDWYIDSEKVDFIANHLVNNYGFTHTNPRVTIEIGESDIAVLPVGLLDNNKPIINFDKPYWINNK